ncbi:hypothetical protein ACFLY8_01490 [Halobacteriota archaeon]
MAFINYNKRFVKTEITSIVHPMQDLLKYHGLIYLEPKIPFNDSISVNIGALLTRTKVEFGDFGQGL